MKTLYIVLGITFSLLFAGAIDNYVSNSHVGCKKINTGTEYTGYDCSDGNYYTDL